ncbi:hypothetical protein SAMN05444166_2454 [Singulisphaera sp. GP187]|nr:hypothetical protein [Singulisphaera sp. GP187]SIO10166.1 hypothetical protein SAMN05444166_2454 [Singulisphaera sp. GP187]
MIAVAVIITLINAITVMSVPFGYLAMKRYTAKTKGSIPVSFRLEKVAIR